MGKTKREPSQEDSFHKHYAAVWGEQRWHDSLYPALARPTRHAALPNRALPAGNFRTALETAGVSSETLESISLLERGVDNSNSDLQDVCVARRLDLAAVTEEQPAESLPFPQPQLSEDPRLKTHLMTHWNMDAASVLAASVLDATAGEKVLDLCAAPGGKSVALAQDLFFRPGLPSTTETANSGGKTLLCSNEADKTRFRRLAENLKAYLPDSLNVTCTNIDATAPNAHRELAIAGGWDRILVDAPCSSERHIIHAHMKAQASGRVAPEMTNWRPGSTKRLQETQVKLLITALRLVKEYGRVLYATCSVEPGENDGVIDKVRSQLGKERKKGLISWDLKLDESCAKDKGDPLSDFLEQSWAERTTHGWIVLPDHASGGRWGPLFFTKWTKVPAVG